MTFLNLLLLQILSLSLYQRGMIYPSDEQRTMTKISSVSSDIDVFGERHQIRWQGRQPTVDLHRNEEEEEGNGPLKEGNVSLEFRLTILLPELAEKTNV
ncbi:hypothetical protein N7495_004762 [Penicillium taxi]|uniref:uncharacterized protein n=1 Tax=Penicillium taxi TaxID=168475 RepID=UPI00254557B8|nr:uncharacterized protein N7495_004762 [Penicillium taxi]KAJ5900018.1 hypothetical protein N7495_004762 [Penicillium taxi]